MYQLVLILITVAEVDVERPNIAVSEDTPEVEICILLTTGVTERVVVTAETGPKSGATNPATGRLDIHYSHTVSKLSVFSFSSWV